AQVMAEAQGEAARFLALLEEYKKAPEVTRERLYLEAMQEVLGASSKAMVSIEDGAGGPVMYLPLDKLMERRGRSSEQQPVSNAPVMPSSDEGNSASSAES